MLLTSDNQLEFKLSILSFSPAMIVLSAFSSLVCMFQSEMHHSCCLSPFLPPHIITCSFVSLSILHSSQVSFIKPIRQKVSIKTAVCNFLRPCAEHATHSCGFDMFICPLSCWLKGGDWVSPDEISAFKHIHTVTDKFTLLNAFRQHY